MKDSPSSFGNGSENINEEDEDFNLGIDEFTPSSRKINRITGVQESVRHRSPHSLLKTQCSPMKSPFKVSLMDLD